MSPAANTPGALVCISASTTTPSCTRRPAALGERGPGARPRPSRRDQAATTSPLSSSTWPGRMARGLADRWNRTPCCSCTLLTNRPSASPQSLVPGERVAADHVHLEAARVAAPPATSRPMKLEPMTAARRVPPAAGAMMSPAVGQATQRLHMGQHLRPAPRARPVLRPWRAGAQSVERPLDRRARPGGAWCRARSPPSRSVA